MHIAWERCLTGMWAEDSEVVTTGDVLLIETRREVAGTIVEQI
jgi:hypothetical protein